MRPRNNFQAPLGVIPSWPSKMPTHHQERCQSSQELSSQQPKGMDVSDITEDKDCHIFGVCGKGRRWGASTPTARPGLEQAANHAPCAAREGGSFLSLVAPPRGRTPRRAETRRALIAFPPVFALSSLRSTSMFDMRCEEEAAVQPHSRARQEQLQLINNQLREEDDKWQDDLARWKSRRRSVSQDLIKKEEERKKMEKLLAGEDGTSERRKSIKTYREIVQEKERRERELHEAYKNARSQEEAEGILQQYIERFTISEAVLERLEMPKILERSHSTEPNLSSFLNDPNPMKYLRQQSLPPPKFTATVETTIARASVLDTSMSAGSGSPSKTVTPKAVPMLTPKPYSQPKNSQEVLKTFK
ncbi:LIM and calponin domains-containing protein 1, partial [Saguinus oedipus]